MFPVKIVRVER